MRWSVWAAPFWPNAAEHAINPAGTQMIKLAWAASEATFVPQLAAKWEYRKQNVA